MANGLSLKTGMKSVRPYEFDREDEDRLPLNLCLRDTGPAVLAVFPQVVLHCDRQK